MKRHYILYQTKMGMNNRPYLENMFDGKVEFVKCNLDMLTESVEPMCGGIVNKINSGEITDIYLSFPNEIILVTPRDHPCFQRLLGDFLEPVNEANIKVHVPLGGFNYTPTINISNGDVSALHFLVPLDEVTGYDLIDPTVANETSVYYTGLVDVKTCALPLGDWRPVNIVDPKQGACRQFLVTDLTKDTHLYVLFTPSIFSPNLPTHTFAIELNNGENKHSDILTLADRYNAGHSDAEYLIHRAFDKAVDMRKASLN